MIVDTSPDRETMSKGTSKKVFPFLDKHKTFLFSLFILGLAVIYINPFQETSISDDWAYILTGHHLYDTGQYHLHEWASANLMFQVYWGELFALVGGFSIGTLHISTLVLWVIGVVSFYLLAQEHGLSREAAGLVSFCLITSPLVLSFVLTFMTDVPALSLLIVGLLLYTRGLKRQSLAYMLAAGLVTVAATFTRPTSLALLAGLGLIFLLDQARFSRWKLYLTGAVPPVVGGWVLLFGGTAAKFEAGTVHGSGEIEFITHLNTFLPNVLLWRPGMFLIYLGLFALPLAIGILAGQFGGRSNPVKLRLKVVAFFGALVLGALLYNVFILNGSWTVPYIGYSFGPLDLIPLLGWLVTILSVMGGIIIGPVIWDRVGSLTRWRALPLEQRFLDAVTLVLLAYSLLFYNVADRYLFVLLPFCLIGLGRYIQPRLAGLQSFIIVSGFVVMLVMAIDCRYFQAEQAAEWQASNYVLSLGVAPIKILGPWGWYASYNYADYLSQNPNLTNVNYLFDVWMPRREKEADYRITINPNDLVKEGWQIVKTVPYSDPLFQQRPIYILQRGPGLIDK